MRRASANRKAFKSLVSGAVMRTLTVIGELHPEGIKKKYGHAIKRSDHSALSTSEAAFIGLSPTSSLEDLDKIVTGILEEETKIVNESDAECLFLEGKGMRKRFSASDKKLAWVNAFVNAYYTIMVQYEEAYNEKAGTKHTKYFDKWDTKIRKDIENCLQKYNSVLAIVGVSHLDTLEKTFSATTRFSRIEVPSQSFSQLRTAIDRFCEYFLNSGNPTTN